MQVNLMDKARTCGASLTALPLTALMVASALTVFLATPAFAKGVPLDHRLLLQSAATQGATAADEATVNVAADAATGVVIVATDAEGPAAQAGIVRGDILLTVDDVAIDSAAALYGVVVGAMLGDEVMVVVQHGDDLRSFAVTLGQIDDRAYLGVQVIDAPGADGLVVLPAGEVETETAQAQATEIITATAPEIDAGEHDVIFLGAGLFVAEVMEDSPAAQAGLTVGDLILALDGEPVMTPDALVSALAAYAPGDGVMLRVQKGGLVGAAMVEVPITLGAAPDDATRAYLGIRMVAMPADMTIPAVPSVRAYASPTTPTSPMSPGGGVGYAHPGLGWMPHMGEACGQGDVIIQQYFFGPTGEMPYGVAPAVPSGVPGVPGVPQSFVPPMTPGQPLFIYQAGVDAEDESATVAEEHVVIVRDPAQMTWTMAAPAMSPPAVSLRWVEIEGDTVVGTAEVALPEAPTIEIKRGAGTDAWY